MQQKQTLDYFDSHAADWHNKATAENNARVNVIAQRNGVVVHVAKETGAKTAMDVGCGTGDLVVDLAAQGIDALGVDFAPDMIEISKKKALDAKVDAKFEVASIFDYDFGGRQFDVIAANGFIEYVSYEDFDRFLDLAHARLTDGGALVVGSRNRLFNLFSMNAYTQQEIDGGHFDALLAEAMYLCGGGELSPHPGVEPAPLQPVGQHHADTGIAVDTRYQFTPLQLVDRFAAHGFAVERIYPAHIHGVAPAFKGEHGRVHCGIANLLQGYSGQAMSLIHQASTFMTHARKA